jgi:NAD(P)H-hydrate repair Nnr-like enzyme with NAD(P)H-hydrate epimerase domain
VNMEDEDIQYDRYEIVVSGTGDTVWINGNDGLCWARFSRRFGIDVHRSASMQQADTECLYCTHGKADGEDWAVFRAEVLRHHGVAVDAAMLSFD